MLRVSVSISDALLSVNMEWFEAAWLFSVVSSDNTLAKAGLWTCRGSAGEEFGVALSSEMMSDLFRGLLWGLRRVLFF